MKKLLSIILILAMLFSFVSCGQTNEKTEISEEQVNPAPVNVAEELYIVDGTKNKYYPGDTITIPHIKTGASYSYSVMVNGHLFRDFSVVVDDEEVSSFKINGAGNIFVEVLKDGYTSFTIDTGNNEFDFTWVNGEKTKVPVAHDTVTEPGKTPDNQSGANNTQPAVASKNYYNCNNPVQPIGMKWKVNPQSDDDYLNNLYYLIVAGKYNYKTSVDKYDWKMDASECKPYFAAHCDLMDYLPYEGLTFYFSSGNLYLCSNNETSIHRNEKMVDDLYVSRQKSADVYSSVHKRYSFTAQTEIREILERYLKESYSYAPSLVCGFNNVLDLENIESYGLIVADANNNEHVVSYVPVKGTEYIVELSGAKKGIYTLSEIDSKLGCHAKAESLACVKKKAQKGYFDTRLRPECCDSIKMKTLPSGDTGLGVTYKELAKFYTGNANLSYNSNPSTQMDHYNNLMFVLLTAQWDYRDIKISSNTQFKWISEPIKSGPGNYNNDINNNLHTFVRFCPLLAPFSNGTGDVIVYYDGSAYHVSTGYFPISYLMQPKEYLREICEVYKLAKSKYNDFRKQGKITSASTQYDIAKAYSQWFISLGNVQIDRGGNTNIYSAGNNTLNNIESYYTATPYSALITRNAQCAGRSAAMVLLLRMEGISAYGVTCGPIPQKSHTGHVVPWMLLDGKEYAFEYVGGRGVLPINKEAMTVPGAGHLLQEYSYNLVLKEAGLEYNKESLSKVYMDSKGNALAQ